MLNIENNTELNKKIKSIQEWETEWKNLVIDSFNNIDDNSWNDELAVKNIVEGNKIKNIQALANPEILKEFKNLNELKT